MGHEKPTQVRWLVFVLAGAASWLLYLHRYSWGVITPAFKKDHPELDDTQIGLIGSAFMAAYALFQVPLGLMGDLLGPRLVLSSIVFLWSLSLVALGWLHGAHPALLMSLFGLMQAGAYPLIGKVSRHWFPLGYRTTVQGIVTALGRVGAACAPIIVATVLMGWLHFTWQESLAIIAAPGLLLALAVAALLRNSPQEHPWTNEAERELLALGGEGTDGAPQPTRLDTSAVTLLSFGTLLFYAFASTFADMLYVYWIPTFLREGKGLSNQEMGLFAPLPLIGGAVGGILGGILNDALIRRLGNRRWGRSLVALTGKSLAGVLMAISVSIEDGRLVMVLLLACKFFGDWSLPSQWGAITDMAGKSAATIFGLVNTVGALGGMLGPPVMGWIKDHHGWDSLFLFVAAVYGCAALAWLIIDCRRTLVIPVDGGER